jgi:hypothetical protein
MYLERQDTATYIFIAILVCGKVHGAVGPSTNLLLDHILVDYKV